MKLQNKIVPITFSAIVVAVALWLQLTTNPIIQQFFNRMSNLVYDIRLKLALEKHIKPHPTIVIVDIDEKSLKAEGQWPWPRTKVAKLIENIRQDGALVIAFDVIFSEPEINIAKAVAQKLKQENLGTPDFFETLKKLQPFFAGDLILANALNSADTVLAVFFHEQRESVGTLPKDYISLGSTNPKTVSLISLPGYTANVSDLNSKKIPIGFITTFLDDDGVLRRSPLIIRSGDKVYPSLALSVAKQYLLVDNIKLHLTHIGNKKVVDMIFLDKQKLYTDGLGQVIVPFKGLKNRYHYYSASDVLENKIPSNALKEKIVFIGSSAIGLGDIVATPIYANYPGVQVHADITAGILRNFFPYRPSWSVGIEVLTTIVFGLLLTFLLPFLRSLALITTCVILLSSMTLVDIWLYRQFGLVLNFIVPFLMTICLMVWNFIYGFFFEGRQRAQITSTFSYYVPPEYLELISENPGAYGLEGQSKNLTIFFTDIRDFTRISENLSADDVKRMLNYFFSEITKILHRYHATIDKFVGDMLMAFWGAPIDDEKHQYHALQASLKIMQKLPKIQQGIIDMGLPAIDIGMGMNSGEVNVGDMGSEFRRAYTVIGDAVNLASRLESLTKFYHVPIIVGEATAANQTAFVFRFLDKVQVVGKTTAVKIFEVMGKEDGIDPEKMNELKRHHQAFHLFLQRRFKEALKVWRELAKDFPNRQLYSVYIKRTEDYLQAPPGDDWNGVIRLSEK